MSYFHLTARSANAKTGPIPVSTTSADSCPPSCPFQGHGCYAEGGKLGLHWGKVTRGERGASWREFLSAVSRIASGQLWRHNQAGDLPGTGERIAAGALSQLVSAAKHTRGFTYTHKRVLGASKIAASNREAIRDAVRSGFVINLSANNPRHADELADLGIAPVTTVLPADAPRVSRTPGGRLVVVCPAQTREGVTCASCQLCANPTRRGVVVGFLAHGASRRAAEAIVTNGGAA